MRTSKAGRDLITQFEGCKLTAYKCPAGIWTIGVGHTDAAGPPIVRSSMTMTRAQAEYTLEADLISFETHVSMLVKVPLTQNQFDVMVSFAFNCGVGALTKSTLLKKLNRREYSAIPAELMKWTKGGGKELPGLVRRRRAEAAMWRAVDETAEIDQDSRVQPSAPEPPKTMLESKEGNAAVLAGASGAIAAAQEIVPVVQQSSDLFSGLSEALGKPVVIAMIVILVACVGIWFWRRQRLLEDA